MNADMPPKKRKEKPCLYDRLPKQAQVKVDAFRAQYDIYFKNQTIAADALKCSQSAIHRYLSGKVLVPMEIADRFMKFTNGVVSVESIFFDLNEYLYDQEKAKDAAVRNVIK